MIKFTLLLMVFFSFYEVATFSVPPVDESKLKSWNVERRKGNPDKFSVTRKSSDYHCYHEWCSFYFSARYNRGQCGCDCDSNFPSFIPSMKTCINASQARSFGGCSHPYFDEQSLLKETVDLTKRGKKSFSITSDETNCSLHGDYFIHDYSGFNSRWKLISDGYFTLELKEKDFDIKWPRGNQALSGRIIRLVVTCSVSSFTGCVLLKAKGTVTYEATVSSAVSQPSTPSSVTESALPLPSLITSSVTTILSTSVALTSSVSLLPSSTSLKTSFLTPSASSTPSTHQSSLLTSSTKRTELPGFVSSPFPPAQSTTPRLTASTTGKILSSFNDVSHNIANTKIVQLSTRILTHTKVPSKTTPTSRISSSSTDVVGPGKKGASASENQSGVVIGAAVGGALVLGIFVLIIVFWKRRKASERSEKTIKPVKNAVNGSSGNEIQLEIPMESNRTSRISQDSQSTYQGLLKDNRQTNEAAIYSKADDNYDNCTVYQTLDKENPGPPVYLGLSKGLPEGAPTTGLPNSRHSTMPNPKLKPNAGEIPSSKANGTIGVPKSNSATGQLKRGPSIAQEPVYNVLDGPGTGPRTTADPLYNVLEGHEYATPNVDPLYNVLEGPDANRSVPKSGPNTTEEAVYNVLEGPDITNGPTTKQGTENDAIYNVLEAPDSDKNSLVSQGRSGPGNEPLYSVLEEQVGDGPKQKAPNKSSSIGGVANPAYEQTLDFDASYAAVRRPGARGESLYEPLRRPGQDVYQPLG